MSAPVPFLLKPISSPSSLVCSIFSFSRSFLPFPAQLTPSATTGTLDLTNSDTHGKCNVVYVGIEVTEAQKVQLQDYSRTFNVRIVYFNAAATANDPEVNSRLGISQDFTEPLVSAPFIALSGET